MWVLGCTGATEPPNSPNDASSADATAADTGADATVAIDTPTEVKALDAPGEAAPDTTADISLDTAVNDAAVDTAMLDAAAPDTEAGAATDAALDATADAGSVTCAQAPCKNGAKCVDGASGVTCQCTDGWKGAVCDVDSNPCSPNPCKNGGKCVNAGDGKAACNCVLGWAGPTCEATATPCASNAACDDGVPCTAEFCVTTTCSKGAQFGNTCFFAVQSKLTWDEAEAACVKEGGHLASIASEPENAAARAAATAACGGLSAWIGLTDGAKEGMFTWSSGEPVTFTRWKTGEPSDVGGSENYVEMYSEGSWNDRNTTDGSMSCYVCELPGTTGATGTCQATYAKCDDLQGCTDDMCDPVKATCTHTPIDCNDWNACTTDSCLGNCHHNAADCDDADPCTIDACDPDKGCSHAPKSCDDGSACSTDACVLGTCTHAHAPGADPVACADGNDCKTDSCKNGGTCIDAYQSVLCTCVSGWTGALCEIDATPCDPNPCLNNGVCSQGTAPGAFSCACVGDWGGKICNEFD